MHKLINQKPKAILLDWDNTLANSWRIIHKCLNEAFTEFGHEPWSLEDVIEGRRNIHHSLRQSFPVLFGEDKWEAAAEVYFKHFKECHLQEIELLEGAEDTIKKLAEGDFHLAIISNKTGPYLREELRHLNIDHYFDIIVGAKDTVREKPHPDQIYFALDHANIDATENAQDIWMVGDSKTDIEAAKNAKVRPILYGTADIKEYEKDEPISKIRTHTEFQQLADSLKS